MSQTSWAFTTQQMQCVSHLLHSFSILASYIIHHHTYDLRNDLLPFLKTPPPPQNFAERCTIIFSFGTRSRRWNHGRVFVDFFLLGARRGRRYLAGCVTQREMSRVSVAGCHDSAGSEGDVELVNQQGGDREDQLDSTKEVAMNRTSYEEECTKFAVDLRWIRPLLNP